MDTAMHTSEGMRRQVWLLGALRVESEKGPLPIRGSKARGLFAFLVLQPKVPYTREVLADLFWPDAPPDRVRRNLTHVLYRLRQALGPAWLRVAGDRVALRTGADLWVDVWEFERLHKAGDLASLEKAVALYAGDLLPEIYDDWVLVHRVVLREKYLAALLRLGQLAEQHGKLTAAFEYYHRLTQADLLHEEAYRGLMRTLAGLGRLAEALATYTRLEGLLEAELGVLPAEETRRLAGQLRSELELARQVVAFDRQRLTHQPFVGRGQERATALAAVEAAIARQGGLLAIEGVAGIGKTRLLEEIASGARWRGATVAAGSATPHPAASPFAPLIDTLAAALAGARATQVETLLPAETLAALSPLHPAWRHRALLQRERHHRSRHDHHRWTGRAVRLQRE